MKRSSALPRLPLLPALELAEQLVLLLRGQRWAAGGLLPLVDEAREYRPEILKVRRGRHLRIPLQPLLGGREAPPPGEFRGDAHFMPFRVVPRIEERLKAGEERFDKISQIAIALGPLLEVGGDQHGTYCDGVHGLILRYYARIIRGSEPGRHVTRGHRRVQWNGEEVKAVIGIQVAEDRRRFTGDERHGGDFAPMQLVERHLLIIVCHRGRDVQKFEEPRRRNRRSGTANVDVDLLICQVRNRFDVLPREKMELLIVK